MTTFNTSKRHAPLANALLWASAFVIMALIIMQAGRAGMGRRTPDAALASMSSMADVVTRVGEYSMLTFNAGSDDVLAIVDGRGEEMYFYRVRNQRELEFLGRDDLKTMFATAKKIGAGRLK